MSATSAVAHEGRETGWREGSAVVGGSEPYREYQEWGRSFRPTHASFFSGVGGMDIGLERAGWRTVSFSEIDPYASAVLARHWPEVPNLGDITRLVGEGTAEPQGVAHHGAGANAQREAVGTDDRDITALVGHQRTEDVRRDGLPPRVDERSGDADAIGLRAADGDWQHATLWSGGFPCTDLSIAGKRAGLINDDGSRTRSGLAYAFLDLVERHRPQAILLENVYGLLSSNTGRDLGSLVRQMAELRYVGAWRGTDAQWFGVPQRRKRVFILAFDAERHPDPDGPGKVLAVATRCGRDHKAEREAWAKVAPGVGEGPLGGLYVGPVDGAFGHHGVATPQQSLYMGHYISGPVRAGGQRLTHQELDDIGGLIAVDRAPSDTEGVRAPSGVARLLDGSTWLEDPEGLDSHRYRCVGNGVAAPVAHWIGTRLMRYFA